MPVAKGLAGIEVDDTSVSDIDGVAGQLRYRGYPVEELISLPFTDVAWLILHGELPNAADARTFAATLATASALDERTSAALLAIGAVAPHPMLALQAATPLLISNPDGDLLSQGVELIARMPTALATLTAGARGDTRAPTVPDEADYGSRVLTQLVGRKPSDASARAFEQVQILQLDHGFNAGTFTARVVASTLAPFPAVVAAALGALFGRLHGGADQAAVEMARAIGSPARAASVIAAMTERGEKIMGMGHREYRVIDPRSLIVEQIAERLAAPDAGLREFQVLRAIAVACANKLGERSKPIHPNLEFYKGVVYLAVGLRPELFTPAFALARAFGYLAHVLESRVDNRIMRPAARYVGESRRSVGQR